MSSDRNNQITRRGVLFSSLGLLTLAAGCQMRPLYGENTPTRQHLAAISFSEAKDRVGQEVRNKLIFLAGGGQGEPANPEYLVELNVKTDNQDVLWDRTQDTATAGRVTVSGDYTLRKAKDGSILRIAHRQAVALVDQPTQEFAKLRAKRDAENRAANELAELIIADLAAILSK